MATTKIEWRKSKKILLKYQDAFDDPFEDYVEGIIGESFAIHITGTVETKERRFYSDDTYTLSHKPTGKTICKLIPSIELAKELADALHALDLDWSKIRKGKEAKGSGAKEIKKAFMKKHNIPDTKGPKEPE